MKEDEPKQISIQIHLDEEVAQGIYANFVVVQHSSSEFILDFIFINPSNPPRAKVRSRVILSPEHTKRLFNILRENLAHYEHQFGEIKLPSVPKEIKSTVQ